MPKVLVDKDFLVDGLGEICDEIRLKTGGTADLAFPAEMKQAVRSITSSGITPTGKKEITENGDDIDVTTYAAVKVNVSTGGDPVEQAVPEISVSAGGLVTASATQAAGIVGSGTESATHQLSSEDDADFQETNIRNGVTLFGKTGTYGADVTAGASDVRNGQTFIGPDGEATGTMAEIFGSTFTPGTADRTVVASNRYTLGPIIIKGEPKLVAANIKKDVVLYDGTADRIVGTYAGGGGGGGGQADASGMGYTSGITINDAQTVTLTTHNRTGIIGVILSRRNVPAVYVGDYIDTYAAFLDTVHGTTRVLVTAAHKTAVILAADGASHASISDSGIVLRVLSTDDSLYGFSGLSFGDTASAYMYSLICLQ